MYLGCFRIYSMVFYRQRVMEWALRVVVIVNYDFQQINTLQFAPLEGFSKLNELVKYACGERNRKLDR